MVNQLEEDIKTKDQENFSLQNEMENLFEQVQETQTQLIEERGKNNLKDG